MSSKLQDLKSLLAPILLFGGLGLAAISSVAFIVTGVMTARFLFNPKWERMVELWWYAGISVTLLVVGTRSYFLGVKWVWGG
jgi:hypothetical protein